MVGGDFYRTAGIDRRTVARLNADGSVDASFDPGFGVTGANDIIVKSIVIQSDGKIIIGGDFTSYNTTLRRRIARVNINGSLDTIFNAGFSSNAYEINDAALQPDGRIIVAGANNFAARLNSDGSRDTSLVTSVNSVVTGAAVQTSGKILISGYFSTINGTPRTGIGRLLGNVAQSRRAPFDFDGDSKTDISIFRPSSGAWWINSSSNNQTVASQFGSSSDKLVPEDYTGDGKVDIAFFRPAEGFWYILRSENDSFYGFPFGSSGDIPVPGDYDGDAKFDAATFRPSNNGWYLMRSTSGTISLQFGISGDQPVPNAFVR